MEHLWFFSPIVEQLQLKKLHLLATSKTNSNGLLLQNFQLKKIKPNYKHGYDEESLAFKLAPFRKSKSLFLILTSLINYCNKSTDLFVTISCQNF